MELQEYEQKHIKMLRKSVPECTLFLKRNKDFPLAQPGEISVYGNGVRGTIKGGTGSGEVNSRYSVSIEEGLEAAGFSITTKDWLDEYDRVRAITRKNFKKVIKARAKANKTSVLFEAMGVVVPEDNYDIPLNGDTVTAIYVLARISGEGADREFEPGDVKLTDTEIRQILELNKKHDKFMLVLNVGGVIDLSPVMEVDNILLLSQLGVETGAILADIILGQANPSGKLTTTWSACEDYCPDIDFGDNNNTYYNEGIYVGYRYFDTVGKKALFPFGYGLGYSDFEMNSSALYLDGNKLIVSARVKNIGEFAGKEVVQAYVSCPSGQLDRPYQELVTFRKTDEIKPGQETTIELRVGIIDLAAYNTANSCYMLEAGDYIVRVGSSSANTQAVAIIRLAEDVIIKKCKNIFEEQHIQDKVYDIAPRDEGDIPLPVYDVPLNSFYEEKYTYTSLGDIDPFIESLSLDEIIKANIGAYKENAGVLGIIGDASSKVAGAAGESTRVAEDKGFSAMVMADGPAGLRLQPDYYIENGEVHGVGAAIPESFVEYLPGPAKVIVRIATKPKKVKSEILHQYATAIPIGTAIAQSFNLSFANMCGDIVGDEMERFGVHLWLAPGMNIHRDIRCGRNFEYYSEDPILTGSIATAITKGVQSHEGKGVTIKHYAVNNQERNRYSNNSVVSERALREIYLKGFEICVKCADPKSIMTSYNLCNGQHTSESKGLINDILRIEWGYSGMVMTDWLVAGIAGDKKAEHPMARACNIAAAGGDITMPGCDGDYKSIKEAVDKGYLSVEQLKINATRVYRLSQELCK